MTVAIIGCGFTGNALKVWLERRNPEIKILISDPAIGYFDDVYNREARVDAYFV